ncbi:MAG: inositol monophosphatase, partial [Halodesulfurarchaeum sp.]
RAAIVERAARAGAEVALAGFRTDLEVETKAGKTDVVTQADRDAQARVEEVITDTFPGETIVGEEGNEEKTVPETGSAWVIDPIDGTANYVRGIRTWATSVAAVEDGNARASSTILPAVGDAYVATETEIRLNDEPVTVSERADPETFVVVPTIWWPFERRDEYATAFEAIVRRFGDARRIGCAQAALGMLASGQFDAVITNVFANPWDTVAGAHMVELAGGTVTDVHGKPWSPGAKGLVASNGQAHDLVLEAAREIVRAEH